MSGGLIDPRMSRRALLGRASTGALGLAAYAALGQPGARAAAEELKILFPGGSWQEMFSATFAEPFTEATGTRFIWRPTLNPDPMVIAQAGNPQWDLVHGQQKMSFQLGPMGLLVEWTEDRLPNLKDIHPSFRYPYLAGAEHTPYGLAVNTKRIRRDITSWLDLWDPELKGRVGFPQWVWTGQELFHFYNRILGGSEDDADPGMTRFKELFATNDVVVTENVEHTIQLLVAEEIWIAPFYSARTRQAAEKGAPVEFLLSMEEGALSFVSNPGVVANRPRESEELAFAFVNTTLDPERQIAFARLTGYPPTNLQAIKNLPSDLAHMRYGEEELDGLGKVQRSFDYARMLEVSDQLHQRWKVEVLAA